jgi:hypothetical protein
LYVFNTWIVNNTVGIFGSSNWMASGLGKLGGSSRSEAKASASRNNGKLGGRPKKTAV